MHTWLQFPLSTWHSSMSATDAMFSVQASSLHHVSKFTYALDWYILIVGAWLSSHADFTAVQYIHLIPITSKAFYKHRTTTRAQGCRTSEDQCTWNAGIMNWWVFLDYFAYLGMAASIGCRWPQHHLHQTHCHTQSPTHDWSRLPLVLQVSCYRWPISHPHHGSPQARVVYLRKIAI